MIPVACAVLAVVLSATPAEVKVRPGETLSQVAERALGDPGAAAELKALNGLKADEVPSGTTALKLPGPERDAAARTLQAARATVSQAKEVPEPKRQEAQAKLKEAEALFTQARYAEAQKAADAAWQIVSEGKSKDTRFSVDVSRDGGTTKVTSAAGAPVRVEAQGESQAVFPGQTVVVEKGKPPPPPEEPLRAPTLVSPQDREKLARRAARNGVGPVVLAWEPVSGALQYEVVVTTDKGAEVVKQTVPKPELTVQALKEGHYQWLVRAVSDGRKSDPSSARSFELLRDLKLSAKQPTTWK